MNPSEDLQAKPVPSRRRQALAKIEDAKAYADHVLHNPHRKADHEAARRLKDRAFSHQLLVEGADDAVFLMDNYPIADELDMDLALLRGRAPAPRPLSVVTVDMMAFPPSVRAWDKVVHGEDDYRFAERLLFLGEHPNMPGHGAVQDPATGRLYVGVYLGELVERVEH